MTIVITELIPKVLAAAAFGPQRVGMVVQFVVDNAAVVKVLNSMFCPETYMIRLVRLLVFYAAKFNFRFTAVHIPGKKHVIVDVSSRNKMSFFLLSDTLCNEPSSSFAQLPPALADFVSQDLP